MGVHVAVQMVVKGAHVWGLFEIETGKVENIAV